MADRRVTFVVGANVRNFIDGMEKVQSKFQRMGRNMQRLGSDLTQKLSLPLAGVAGISLKTAADFETLRQSMNALNGSVEEGTRNFERLKEFSARTPFQLQDLAKAQNMLQGFGMAADDAFESLTMIGDIAAITGGDISGIGIAFGQAAAEGRLMSRDIRQLINQGVPAIKLLAETMGVAQSEIFDLASEGKISFDILQQAFRDATTEGGMFANGMAQQANTLAGRFSTLRDNVSIALGDIGESIDDAFNIRGLITELTNQIKRAVNLFDELSKETKQRIMMIAGLLAASGPLLLAFGGVIKAVGFLAAVFTSKFAIIGGAIAGVVVTGQWFVDNWAKFEGKISNVTTSYVVAFQKMAKGIMEAIRDLIDFIVNRTGPGFVADVFGWDLSGWVNDMNGLNSTIQDMGDKIEKNTDELVEGINKDRELDWTSFTESAKHALELTKNTIINGLRGILNSTEIGNLIDEIEAKWAEMGQFETPSPTQGGGGSTSGGGSSESKSPGKVFTADSFIQQQQWFEALNNTVNNFNTDIKKTADLGQYMGQRLGEAFAQALVFSDKLGESLKNIGKQLLSKGIVNFVSMALTGGLGGLFKNGLFGKGGALGKLIGVNDAIISPKGDVITTDPADYLIATKNPGFMAQSVANAGGGGRAKIIHNVIKLNDRVLYESMEEYKDLIN